jgi:SAM-dependent methyltransferase
MNNQSSESLQSLKKQYDNSPFPHIPLEQSNKDKYYNRLFINDINTSNYLYQQKVINSAPIVILDAGCGSGWTSLTLAEANPQAKIVCVDLSSPSLEVAKERLNFHGFNNVEFHQLVLEDLAKLGYQFDYINCEDVLYVTPDPIGNLKALKSVLKPKGIIRANLHSYYQRFDYYRSQELFKCIGLFEENPEDLEIEVVIETMENLKDEVNLKIKAWGKNISSSDLKSDKIKENILMNHLIVNDKGYTVPELFKMLKESELEFLSMVNWRQWEVRDLFKDRNNLPFVWEMGLDNASQEEKLHLFELLNPVHRVIDFWCVQKDESNHSLKPLSSWEKEDWQSARIYLHPQLKSSKIKDDLLESIRSQQPWEISKYITLTTLAPIVIESNICALLLNFWDKSQTIEELVETWLKIQPIDLTTLEAKTTERAYQNVIDIIIKLETFLYVLVEK